jgi:PhzF family phenazine biosynthesis protein
LATAKVLFQEIGIDSEVLAFDTRSGPLFAHRVGTAVRIDLPANPSKASDPPEGLLEALGIKGPKNIEYSPSSRKILLEVEDEEAVLAVNPDFKALNKLTGRPDVKGVIVTARGGGPFDDGRPSDFVSRFFAPWWGVDEDPVTGAAHTVLGPYWSARLGKKDMTARQVSARGGELLVRYEKEDGRVHLTGEAVIVLDGSMRLGE